MSTSLNANGRLSQTSDSTDLACVQRPQFSLVNRVILQDNRSKRVVGCMFVGVKILGEAMERVESSASDKVR
jgi:hypothetical protein